MFYFLSVNVIIIKYYIEFTPVSYPLDTGFFIPDIL